MTSTVSAAVNPGDPAIGQQRLPPAYMPGESSMWFFIIGDLLIFGVYFIAYMVYRGQNHELFLQSQQYMNQAIGIINTVILLTSSFFVALATESARSGNAAKAFKLIGVAIAIGCCFPVLKMVEWVPKLNAGLTPGENQFFMFYYLMTGLHLIHVVLGLVILCFVMRSLRVSTSVRIKFVESGGIYWHMVDLLWLILLALFYLMR